MKDNPSVHRDRGTMLPGEEVRRFDKDTTFAGWVIAHPDTLALMQKALDETNIKGYPDPSMKPGKVFTGHKALDAKRWRPMGRDLDQDSDQSRRGREGEAKE